jgi:hypothetical protein
MSRQERRAYPRINKNVRLKLATHSFDIYTNTKNLSCAGAYCEINRLIPSMTKVDILLFLPGLSDEKKIRKLKLKGVVVRSEPNILDKKLLSTNIAIFFTDIKEKDKQSIAELVNRYL